MKTAGLSVLMILGQMQAQTSDESLLYISYTSNEIKEHKDRVKANMASNPLNLQDVSYQMERALRTISGTDSDYIPKIKGAGEIFTNEDSISYQLMHDGTKIVLKSYYDVQWLVDVIYGLKGHHEPQEEKCFYEILKYIPEGGQ